MTTNNFRPQQRPDSGSNERINASEQDTIITNPKENVSVKDDVADCNSPANSHNLADSRTVLSLQNVKVASRLSVEGLRAKKGECVHIIGPNGAGKSSLMRTIATLQSPDSGSIIFGDIDVLNDNMSLRKVLGYLPQSFGVYPKMSAQDLLDYFATLKGISNIINH